MCSTNTIKTKNGALTSLLACRWICIEPLCFLFVMRVPCLDKIWIRVIMDLSGGFFFFLWTNFSPYFFPDTESETDSFFVLFCVYLPLASLLFSCGSLPPSYWNVCSRHNYQTAPGYWGKLLGTVVRPSGVRDPSLPDRLLECIMSGVAFGARS